MPASTVTPDASKYADDAAAFPPDMARVDGRQNIQKLWQGAIDMGISELTLTTREVQESGDFAYESGTFSLKAPGKDSKLVDAAGKYVVVWKKGQDGSWKALPGYMELRSREMKVSVGWRVPYDHNHKSSPIGPEADAEGHRRPTVVWQLHVNEAPRQRTALLTSRPNPI